MAGQSFLTLPLFTLPPMEVLLCLFSRSLEPFTIPSSYPFDGFGTVFTQERFLGIMLTDLA